MRLMHRISALLVPAAAVIFAQAPGQITGRVVDDTTGAPLKSAYVFLMAGGNPSASSRTDATGGFQIQAGDSGGNLLMARKTGYTIGAFPLDDVDSSTGITIRLVPNAVITGRVVDEDGEPMEGVTVTALRYDFLDGQRQLSPTGTPATTNDLGEYRLFDLPQGQYFVGATNRAVMGYLFGVSGASVYRPLFYPGVSESSQAVALSLRSGDVRGGIDLRLAPEESFELHGRVVDGRSGEPVRGARVSLLPEATAAVPLYSQTIQSLSLDNGEFRAAGLTRGDYTMECVVEAEGGGRLYAVAHLAIVASDVDDVEIVARPTANVRGRARVAGASELPAGLGQVQVVLTPGLPSMRMAPGGAGAIQPDGVFEIEGLSAAPYVLEVYGMPDTYYLAAARYGDADALASGVSLISGVPCNLELTFSPRAGRITGVVQDESSDPLAGATVVLIPDTDGPARGDLYKRASTNENGQFEIGGVTPGLYTALALDKAPFGVERDPMLVQLHRNRIESVRVGEGEQQTVDLRVARSE